MRAVQLSGSFSDAINLALQVDSRSGAGFLKTIKAGHLLALMLAVNNKVKWVNDHLTRSVAKSENVS